jgi:hypothetical protein
MLALRNIALMFVIVQALPVSGQNPTPVIT